MSFVTSIRLTKLLNVFFRSISRIQSILIQQSIRLDYVGLHDDCKKNCQRSIAFNHENGYKFDSLLLFSVYVLPCIQTYALYVRLSVHVNVALPFISCVFWHIFSDF